ncbi:MAG: hypothetical protein AAF065_14595 [Verrucomicrobiota bacterium]
MNKETGDRIDACTDVEEIGKILHGNRPDSVTWSRAKMRLDAIRFAENQIEQRKTNALTRFMLWLTIGIFILTVILVLTEFNIIPTSSNGHNEAKESTSEQHP